MAKRITPLKKLFCEHWVLTGNATASARKAGYSNPERQGLRLLEKDTAGNYKDAAIARELAKLRSDEPDLKPPAAAGDDEDAMRTEIVENLRAIARDETASSGARVAANAQLAKMHGVDRPKGQDNRDAEAAVALLKTLMGIRDE